MGGSCNVSCNNASLKGRIGQWFFMMKTIHNWQRMGAGLGAGVMALWLGCSSPDEYYNDADKEVYTILNNRQNQV